MSLKFVGRTFEHQEFSAAFEKTGGTSIARDKVLWPFQMKHRFPKISLLRYKIYPKNMKKNNGNILVYPSILSGDFGRLAEEAKALEQAGADAIHVDIMDGHFVPNLTLGPKAIAAINRATDLFLDVHAMIYNPYDYVEAFAGAGADRITFHFEATENVDETLDFVRRCGIQAGLAFRPETSFSMIPKYLTKCDLVLLMTVSPGFGGQKFMPEVLEKISMTREFCEKYGVRLGGISPKSGMPVESLDPFNIQVDGGINPNTGKQCVEAGANVLVSGDYLYKQAPDLKQGISSLKRCFS
jgi:ribulose-phosphate 3-epimerase